MYYSFKSFKGIEDRFKALPAYVQIRSWYNESKPLSYVELIDDNDKETFETVVAPLKEVDYDKTPFANTLLQPPFNFIESRSL